MLSFIFRSAFLISLFGAALNIGAQENSATQPESLNHRFTAAKNWVCEVAFADQFGYESLSQENEAFVRQILQEMNVKQNITILRMSKFGINRLGYQNAFVILNYLFVSEDWFNKLSTKEKRFLIGHEAVHIKENHSVCKVIALEALSLVVGYIVKKNLTQQRNAISEDLFDAGQRSAEKTENEGQNTTAKAEVRANTCSSVKWPNEIGLTRNMSLLYCTLPFLWMSRYFEKRADLEAAKTLGNAQDGVTLVNRWQGDFEDPESKFFLLRLKGWLDKYIGKYFTQTHPFLAEREAYLTELAEQQAFEG